MYRSVYVYCIANKIIHDIKCSLMIIDFMSKKLIAKSMLIEYFLLLMNIISYFFNTLYIYIYNKYI